MNKFIVAALGLAASAGAVHALEISGGSLDLSYSAFMDATDVDVSSVSGSVELAFTQSASVQLDLGHDSLGPIDLDNVYLGIHGILHLDQTTSVGAFYTRDRFSLGGANDSVNLYGIEAGHDAGAMQFEGYLGRGELAGLDGTMVGVSARYAMPSTIGVTGYIDYGDVEGGRYPDAQSATGWRCIGKPEHLRRNWFGQGQCGRRV